MIMLLDIKHTLLVKNTIYTNYRNKVIDIIEQNIYIFFEKTNAVNFIYFTLLLLSIGVIDFDFVKMYTSLK